jgi:hypothetical protein
MSDLLSVIEALRAALDAAPSWTEADLARRVGADPADADFRAALRRLDDRLEILVDPSTRTLRGRRRLTADVVDALANRGPMATSDLKAALIVETAPLAEVLGWLQREGRVECVVVGTDERYRMRRGISGPYRTTGSP